MTHHTVVPPSQMAKRVVTIPCPCCGVAKIDVELVQGSWPEDPMGWDVDDYAEAPECDCHDFMEHVPARPRQHRLQPERPAPDYYWERVRDAAVEQIR